MFWQKIKNFIKNNPQKALKIIFALILIIFAFIRYKLEQKELNDWGMYSEEHLESTFKNCKDFFINQNYSIYKEYKYSLYPIFEKIKKNKVQKEYLRQLCSDEFAILYSNRLNMPVMGFEKLTADKIKKINELKPTQNQKYIYQYDKRFDYYANLKKYENLYSKDFYIGQLVPPKNMLNQRAIAQTFVSSNIIPQNKYNLEIYNKIENDIRIYIEKAPAPVYVITGIYFDINNLILLKPNMYAPNYLYKIIYNSYNQECFVYFIGNKELNQLELISYKDFVDRTQNDFFEIYKKNKY